MSNFGLTGQYLCSFFRLYNSCCELCDYRVRGVHTCFVKLNDPICYRRIVEKRRSGSRRRRHETSLENYQRLMTGYKRSWMSCGRWSLVVLSPHLVLTSMHLQMASSLSTIRRLAADSSSVVAAATVSLSANLRSVPSSCCFTLLTMQLPSLLRKEVCTFSVCWTAGWLVLLASSGRWATAVLRGVQPGSFLCTFFKCLMRLDVDWLRKSRYLSQMLHLAF